jgi:transcriptional regulator with XRE-family HTH domain
MANHDDALSVATEVKVWMARRRLTQAELAARVGHDQTWLSKRLAGKVPMTVEDMLDLADALGIRAADLLQRPATGLPGAVPINYRKSA